MGLVAAGLLLLVVNLTVPGDVGAIGILAVFLLTYVVMLTLITFSLWMFGRLFNTLGHELRFLKRTYSLSLKRAYYYATVIAIAPVILLSLQSVGGAGFYEVVLTVLLTTLGCIYVSRRLR